MSNSVYKNQRYLFSALHTCKLVDEKGYETRKYPAHYPINEGERDAPTPQTRHQGQMEEPRR